MRRLPVAFGWLTRRGDPATARGLTRPEIRRDAVRVPRAATADPDSLVRVAGRLLGYHQPALIREFTPAPAAAWRHLPAPAITIRK